MSLPDLDALDAPALEDLVRHHNRLYWDEDAPVLSDTDFDRLVRRLTELAPSSPALRELGPTRFGAEVRHASPMLSLDKCYGDDDLAAWMTSFEGAVVISPKFDGVACSLRYEGGKLALAATRGDGVVGDDVTANARQIRDVPRTIALTGAIEVRGEVFMRLSVFARYREKFSNPRNLTAGALKQKDAKKSAGYELSFAAYELFGTDAPTEAKKLDLLAELGFSAIERRVVEKEDVLAVYRELASRRAALDFEIDGVVMKADRVDEQARLGATSHHPRYALAYKFQGDTGTTILREVEWSVARTGAITPVALVDPVALSGVLVGRASLHHPGYVAKLGLTLGAEVEITRRGGVIPNVERVTKPGTTPIALPIACPSCGGPVHAAPAGDFLYCDAPDRCRAALIGRVAHFLGVTGVDGFGERLLGELYDRALVRAPADLYRLDEAALLAIDRVGEKLAKKLVAQIASRRVLPLETFLRALGLDELGKHVAAILAREYGMLARVLTVTEEELSAIHGIGPIIAASVTRGLAASRARIDELASLVTLEEGPPAPKVANTGPLAGESFVFTGKMATMTREEGEALVKRLGGEARSAVSKGTTWLVVGDDKPAGGKPSSKEKAAAKAGVAVASESDFVARMRALA